MAKGKLLQEQVSMVLEQRRILAAEVAEQAAPKGAPLHVQLSKAERKLLQLAKNLAKCEHVLDKLEEQKR